MNFKKKIKSFLKLRFSLALPTKSKIAILDSPGSNLIKKTLNRKNIPVIATRGVKINIILLFFSLFSNLNLKLGQKYIIFYIKYLKPKIIISHIDNNKFFFSLKNIFPDIIFIFIQNGLSLASQEKNIFKKKNVSWKANYFFCYSKNFNKIYANFLNSKIITIGSFKNNLIKKLKKNNENNLVFISQFIFGNQQKDFYKVEKILLPILYKFCLTNKLNLVIAGRCYKKHEINTEKKFYEKVLFKKKTVNKKNFIFKKLKSETSSYNLIDSSKLTVFVDSALGYQSLARGNKTLVCSARSNYIKNNKLKFGWPKYVKNEGPFWINKINAKKINLKLKKLNKMSKYQWRINYRKLINNLIYTDNGNKKFKNLISKLIKDANKD